jgi:predicted enzyme related to lactoylglutathione lyase
MNRVIHFEIYADNPQRAISFYKRVFDWEFTSWGESAEYWLIKTGSDDKPGIDGGLMKRRGEIDGQAVIAYVCTIGVESVDDSANNITSSGGQIVVPKMPIPGVGWLIYCKDTEGNIFAIHQEDRNAK